MEWEKVANRYEGWVDGDMVYVVAEDAEGWYWEMPGDSKHYETDGYYDSAEEAMEAVEARVEAEEAEREDEWTAEDWLYELEDREFQELREARMWWQA